MSSYQDIRVSIGSTTYVTGAVGKDGEDASKILVWSGKQRKRLQQGTTYHLKGSNDLDTDGRLVVGEGRKDRPWKFENVE